MNAAQYDLSILIVGFNSVAYLRDCLESIPPAVTRYSYEVLFVNNGDDRSEDLLRAEYPQVRVFESIGNVGFAAGNGYLAENAKGRWLLLLNPDTKLYPGALDVLLDAAAEHPEYEALGGVTVLEDGAMARRALLELPSLSALVRNLIGKGPPSLSFAPGTAILEVDALTGGFMMVRSDWWSKLGGLDSSFFLYAEELDFFKRFKEHGGRVAQIADSRLYHDFGSGNVFSPNRIRFWATGNAHYLHKHYPPLYAYVCIFIIWMTMLKRYLGGLLMSWKKEEYARMSRGFSKVTKAPWIWMWGYNSNRADPRRPLETAASMSIRQGGSSR